MPRMAHNQPKTVLITGVTRGLGHALAEKLIATGQTVVGCGRSAEPIAALSRQHGAPHTFAIVDVADDAQVADWARQLLESHGPPDLLLNNAALINASAPLWQVPAEEFSQVIDVNIKGVTSLIRHFLPAMIERGSGVIVNFSSGWGRSSAPDVAPYCATKWAIEGLTQALAQELPRGLAAVAVNPGMIHTEMLTSCFGPSASSFPTPAQWAVEAVPLLLGLGPEHNGRPLSV